MLQYPSIDSWKKSPLGLPCIAFFKYDGSNLRWEWSPKRGWYKFGTRTQLFDHNTPLYNQAIPLFKNEIGDVVIEQVKDLFGTKPQRITAFTEFYGLSSFAGSHLDTEEKTLKLIDVSVYKKGFIPAKHFVKMFKDYSFAPRIVYEGNMNQPFIEDIRNSNYPVVEGVICKGDDWMAKIKTIQYLNRLKYQFGDKWEKYAE